MKRIWRILILSGLVLGCYANDVDELHQAIICYEDVAQWAPLLDRVGVDVRDEFGTPLFFHVIERGSREAFDAFLEKKVDLTLRDARNRTALMVAAQWGNVRALHVLMPNVHIFAHDHMNHTVFDIAILWDRHPVIEVLAEHFGEMLRVAANRVLWCSPHTREILEKTPVSV